MGHFLRPSLPTRSTLSPPVPSRPPNLVLSFSAALPREVIMLAIATAALIVFSMTAEAAFMKYDYGGREIYKHEDDSYEPSYEHKRGDDYPEPSHKSHYADQYHGHKPSYEIQDYSLRPHHDSYDEDHYGRYAYSVEPSYSHYRHRRAADKKDDEDGEDKKDEDDDDDEEEKKTEVSTETWINLTESLSLIAKKLDDDGGDDDDEDDDDDDEEESKMSESYTYKPNRKYRKSQEPRSYRSKRDAVTKAMKETMDLVGGLREGQKSCKELRKGCKVVKNNRPCRNFCRKCISAECSCNGAQFSKCKRILNK